MNIKKKINFIIKNKYVLLLIAIHIIGLLFLFKVYLIFKEGPIYNYDYPYHLYHCYEIQNYYSEGHKWGYNPYISAGYPGGILNLDNELLQLICMPFSFQNQMLIIKLWVVLILISLPILMYLSTRNFCYNKLTSTISLGVLLIYLYTDYFINDLISFGLFNFILGSILSLFYISLFYRYFSYKRKKLITLILILMTFPFMLFVHASTLIIFIIPFIFLCIIYYRKLHLKNKLIVWWIIFVTFLITTFWIIYPILTQVRFSMIYDSNQFFQIRNFKDFTSDFYYNIYQQGIPYVKIFILSAGFFGIYRWFKKNKITFFIFTSSIISLFIITYGHNLNGLTFLSSIQPYKFIVPLIFFLIIPCSSLIKDMFEHSIFTKHYNLKKWIILLFIFLIVFGLIYVCLFKSPTHHFATQPLEDYNSLKDWLIENTNNRGRLMIEDNLRPDYLFDNGSMLYGLLTIETNKQILGGPHSYSKLAHSLPSLTRNEIFKKDWNISDEQLLNYLNLYNVGWIIVRSKIAKQQVNKKYFQNNSLFKSKNKIVLRYYEGQPYYKFHIYTLNRNLSFIIGGTGDVKVDFNKIKIENLTIEDEDIILKYHWHPTLKATHGLEMEPVYMWDIPVPFIKVLGVNTTEFEIYNSYYI